MRRKGYIAAAILALLLTFTSLNQSFAENRTIHPQAQIHFKNGIKHSVNGNLGSALNEYLKAIEIDPYFARAYNNLGYIYRQQGKVDLAIKYYNKTLELNPKDDTAHTNLASAYEKKGDYDKAIDEFHQALKLDPGSITVELALEKIEKKKAQAEGKTLEAVQAELAALYPEEKTEPSYNKYLDLLNDEEDEEAEVTTNAPTPEKVLDPIYTYDEPETSEKTIEKENQTSNDTSECGILDEVQPPLESSNADNKIEQILSDPTVGALMVLYKK